MMKHHYKQQSSDRHYFQQGKFSPPVATSCDSSVSTQNSDNSGYDDDFHQFPMMKSSSSLSNSSLSLTPRMAMPTATATSTELYYEETKNFWNPNRGLHIKIMRHSNPPCLQVIATDPIERQIETNNEHIFIDLLKVTQKCSNMKYQEEQTMVPQGKKLPLLSLQGTNGKHINRDDAQLKKYIIKYILDRLTMEFTGTSKARKNNRTASTSEFRVFLSPQVGDITILAANGQQQLDILCSKPKLSSLSSSSIDEGFAEEDHDDDDTLEESPRHHGFLNDSSDEEDELTEDEAFDHDEEEEDEKLKLWEQRHHHARIVPCMISSSMPLKLSDSSTKSLVSLSLDTTTDKTLSVSRSSSWTDDESKRCFQRCPSLNTCDSQNSLNSTMSELSLQSSSSTDSLSNNPTPRWNNVGPSSTSAPVEYERRVWAPNASTSKPNKLPVLLPALRPLTGNKRRSNKGNTNSTTGQGIALIHVEDDYDA